MTATDKLREWFLEQVPEAPDEPPPVDDHPPVPRLKVTISALGGRHAVELDERAFACLVTQAGGIVGPELSPTDLGRLISAAKDNDNRALVNLLMQVRDAASPVYSIRADGRLWRPRGVNPNPIPTAIRP